MPELDITASDAHVYDVTSPTRPGAKTEHRVTLPERLLRDLGIAARQEPALIRASVIYLLERPVTFFMCARLTTSVDLDDMVLEQSRQQHARARVRIDATALSAARVPGAPNQLA